MPDRIVVAGPVSEDLAMSWTGLRSVAVKYSVSTWMTAARIRPMIVATVAISAGLPLSRPRASPAMSSSAKLVGRNMNAATATSTADAAAEMKKPRLIAFMPLRSVSRGETAKMPRIEVSTPIPRTIIGNMTPLMPNAALPRISAATSVTS